MHIDWSGRTAFLIIILSSIAIFLIWIFLILSFSIILLLLGFYVDIWAMIGSLSAAVGVVAVVVGGIAAYRELAELACARHKAVIDGLFETLNSPQNISARRWIYNHLPEDPEEGIRTIDEEGRAAIKQVLNSLDRTAFLLQTGHTPERMVMSWMNPMIVKSWLKLAPYVEYEARRRNEPDYYENVRELGERCIVWRKRNLPQAKITWTKDAL